MLSRAFPPFLKTVNMTANDWPISYSDRVINLFILIIISSAVWYGSDKAIRICRIPWAIGGFCSFKILGFCFLFCLPIVWNENKTSSIQIPLYISSTQLWSISNTVFRIQWGAPYRSVCPLSFSFFWKELPKFHLSAFALIVQLCPLLFSFFQRICFFLIF